MKHKIQMTQQYSEYDLITNPVEFTQQTTSPLMEGDNNVCNSYLMKFTYLTDCPNVKESAEIVHFWYKHKLIDVLPFAGASFINDCLLQPMLHVNHSLLQFADITDPLLSTTALFPRFYSHRL